MPLLEITGGFERDELESGRIRRIPDPSEDYAALLSLSTSLPVAGGAAAVVKSVVDTLARVLVGRAVGACVVPAGTPSPIVEMWLPQGVSAPGPDPTRLFPDLVDEWVVELDELAGSTLHVASVHGTLDPESVERALVEHAAGILSSGVRTAVLLKRAKPASREIDDLRAQLIQAEKLSTLGQIVAGVVHELANPVTSIVACADFLIRKADPGAAPPEDLEHLRRIRVGADRILKFTRDLVAYARPASEEPGPVELEKVVEQAFDFSAHELEGHGIAFSTDYSEGAPQVFGQAGPLTQVFINLFTNAAHAMSERGGRLFVQTRLSEDRRHVLIDVTDTGVGILEETLGEIFEPFFTTKAAGHGTGLGLSIVREIVIAHDGTVEAVSTFGEGTTFTVGLPVYRE
jgi:two-component system NtrC family sensor kinase